MVDDNRAEEAVRLRKFIDVIVEDKVSFTPLSRVDRRYRADRDAVISDQYLPKRTIYTFTFKRAPFFVFRGEVRWVRAFERDTFAVRRAVPRRVRSGPGTVAAVPRDRTSTGAQLSHQGESPAPRSVAAYDYELPSRLIAQDPAERREAARLLVVARTGAPVHRTFADFSHACCEPVTCWSSTRRA